MRAAALLFQSQTKDGAQTFDSSDRQVDAGKAMLIQSEHSQPDITAANSLAQHRVPVVAAQILTLLCFAALIKRGIDYLRSMSI